MKTKVELILDNFTGPLDLLLHLIDKNKIDIYDIPIVEITRQYLEYLDNIEEDRLNTMSEFLVMAATLISIKTRMLLPQYEEDEEDPRTELVQQLVEYRYFKKVAQLMSELEKKGYKSLVKAETLPSEVKAYEYKPNVEELFSDIDIDLLYQLFDDVMKRSLDRIDNNRSGFGEIKEDEWTVQDKMQDIRDGIKSNNKLSFKSFINKTKHKMEKIVIFLAMLEMIKMGEIFISQEKLFDDIYILPKCEGCNV